MSSEYDTLTELDKMAVTWYANILLKRAAALPDGFGFTAKNNPAQHLVTLQAGLASSKFVPQIVELYRREAGRSSESVAPLRSGAPLCPEGGTFAPQIA